jgi:hypothetical protein
MSLQAADPKHALSLAGTLHEAMFYLTYTDKPARYNQQQ